MSAAAIRPRQEQIAELTRGQQIPLKPLRVEHLTVIAEVLARAWDDLRRNRRRTLLTGSETEVTALMVSRLNSLLEIDKLWAQLVRGVTRGTETLSYDGKHLEKRPDISVHLTRRNPSFPLIVECKLVDIPNGKKVELYCNEGLVRFIRGEYAWANREAFMLAYVRDGSSIDASLRPILANRQSGSRDVYRTETLPDNARNGGLRLARSTHSRKFRYLREVSLEHPGSIVIWHLWLSNSTGRLHSSRAKSKRLASI